MSILATLTPAQLAALSPAQLAALGGETEAAPKKKAAKRTKKTTAKAVKVEADDATDVGKPGSKISDFKGHKIFEFWRGEKRGFSLGARKMRLLVDYLELHGAKELVQFCTKNS